MTAIAERPGPEAAVSPYLEGVFAPIENEIDAQCTVVGDLPHDLAGVFVRNGSNPMFTPKGRYHWFDGDGMLHALHLENGRATYRNRYVRTRALAAEQSAGEALWTGINERPDFSKPGGPFKDTANTDLVFHAGRLLALWWLGGPCYQVALPSLDTVGEYDFGGTLSTGLTAHPKLDPETGELMVFDYSVLPPYLTYSVMSADGQMVHHTDIDLPGPRLLHDLAITARHTIFLDFPLMWDPELLARGKTKVAFRTDMPARFGILGRHAEGDAIKWFEAESCYMYHTINAWESGDEVVLVGCRIENPLAESVGDEVVPNIDVLRLQPYLHEWRFNLVTGAVRERALDDVMTEFPRMNNAHLGRKTRFSYNPRIAPEPTLLFDGFIKYDTEAGTSTVHEYGDGRFGGETVFAPRTGAKSEADGYVLTFVTEAGTGASEAIIVDAQRVEDGPVARIRIPQRVPIGYHAWWVGAADLDSQQLPTAP
jgi:carotenoid cleavage dioxygenase-like enzyme